MCAVSKKIVYYIFRFFVSTKMKVLLLRPYWRTVSQRVTPPLGLMYLASYLREKLSAQVEIKILDMTLEKMGTRELKSQLDYFRPDLIGITSLTYEAPALKVITELCKEMFPAVPVIVGGPHATEFYDYVLIDTKADVAVIGEGEQIFLELVEKTLTGQDWAETLGIAYRDKEGEVIKTPSRPPINDLDALPFPAWDLVDIERYSQLPNMNDLLKASPYALLFTSRGCPYGCIYCHQVFGKRFRPRSVQSLMKEINMLVEKYKVREFHIVDDIFNWDIERAKEVCREIISQGLRMKIAFPNGIRGDRLDEELIDLLYQAGCYSMAIAVETVTPRLQRMLHKNLDIGKVEKAIENVYLRGIIPKGFFMLGFPTETIEEMENTVKFACRSKLLLASFFSVVPYPRTGLFELFRKEAPQKIVFQDFVPPKFAYFSNNSFYQIVTGFDLASFVKKAYRRFYLNPFRILSLLYRVPWNLKLLEGFGRVITASFSVGRKLESMRNRYAHKKVYFDKLELPPKKNNG